MDNRNSIQASVRRRESVAPESGEGDHTDLHISILPKSYWNGELNCAPYQSVADAVTIGFVRCHVNSSVIALREEIAAQLTDDKNLPGSYIFLKGVGRALVPIRPKQETMLTIENFKSIGSRMPPEIVLLDATSLGQRARLGSKTHLLPRRSRETHLGDPDSSSVENATDLRDRVNKGVRERMQNRAKPNPSKIQAPPPRIQMNPDMRRGNTHTGGGVSAESTPRDSKFRKNNELGRVNKPGSGTSTNTKSSAAAPPGSQRGRKNSVRFPPVTDLEQHNYVTDEYDTNGTPRSFPLSGKNKPIKGKPAKSITNVPRRVHAMGESSDSDDSMADRRVSATGNYSAPERVTKTRKNIKPLRGSGSVNGDGVLASMESKSCLPKIHIEDGSRNWIKYF